MDFKNSVDENDVSHLSLFADEWWNENGPAKALHSMNTLRIPLIKNGLLNSKIFESEDLDSNCLSGLKLLDIGCGGGILSIPLARMGADVTGLDPSPEFIEAASAQAKLLLLKDDKLKFVCSTIEEHLINNKEVYDAVVCSEVLEHVNHKEDFLQCCIDVLKPQGSLFITTINQTKTSYLGAIIFAEYILRLLPIGTHEYKKFVAPEQVTKILNAKGCDTKLVNGMAYIPFINKWNWSSITLINYALHAVKR